MTVLLASPTIRRVVPPFVVAHFTHHLCTGILVPLLPFVRDAFNLNYFQSGLLVSAFSISYGISQIPMGGLADKVDKRLLISFGLVAVALTTLTIGLTGSYYQLMALLVLMGLLGGTYHTAATPLLAQYFTRERRGRILGLHMVGGSFGFLLTPVLAGLIAQAAGWRAAFIYLSIPTIISGAIFWQLLNGVAAVREEEHTQGQGPAPKIFETLRMLGAIFAIALIIQLINSGVNSFLPIFLVDKHGISPSLAAMLVGLVVGSGIVASPLAGAISDRIGRIPVILFSIIAGGPLILLLTFVPFGWPLIINFILLGMTMSSRMPAMESLIMEVVPRERRSTVFGIYLFLGLEVGGLSATVVGFLLDRLGLNLVFTILGVVALGSSTLVLLIRRRI